MSTATEKYQEFKRTYEEARETFVTQAKAAFKEIVAEFFVDFPNVNSFGWNQYTPYFNDGDECVFGVNSDEWSVEINERSDDYDGDEDDDEDEGDDAEEQPKLTEAQEKKAKKAASKMLGIFEDDILRDLYGDHARITVFRKGEVKVDEYEHD